MYMCFLCLDTSKTKPCNHRETCTARPQHTAQFRAILARKTDILRWTHPQEPPNRLSPRAQINSQHASTPTSSESPGLFEKPCPTKSRHQPWTNEHMCAWTVVTQTLLHWVLLSIGKGKAQNLLSLSPCGQQAKVLLASTRLEPLNECLLRPCTLTGPPPCFH